MSILSRAIELAQSGQYDDTHEIERALIQEDEYDFDDISRFFNSPSNKRLVGEQIE